MARPRTALGPPRPDRQAHPRNGPRNDRTGEGLRRHRHRLSPQRVAQPLPDVVHREDEDDHQQTREEVQRPLYEVASSHMARRSFIGNIYKKVNWEIIFLLAGMIPIGIAMANSGADKFLTANLLELCIGQKPYFVIGILFLTTMIISGFVSNNATAIIITPIAIALAQGMNLPVKPFILAVLFASNFSFFTPMGFQTNTIIYGLNIYKFKHFFIIGGILSIVLWLVATFVLSSML